MRRMSFVVLGPDDSFGRKGDRNSASQLKPVHLAPNLKEARRDVQNDTKKPDATLVP